MRSQCRFYLDLLPSYINFGQFWPKNADAIKIYDDKEWYFFFLETSYKEYSPYKISSF